MVRTCRRSWLSCDIDYSLPLGCPGIILEDSIEACPDVQTSVVPFTDVQPFHQSGLDPVKLTAACDLQVQDLLEGPETRKNPKCMAIQCLSKLYSKSDSNIRNSRGYWLPIAIVHRWAGSEMSVPFGNVDFTANVRHFNFKFDDSDAWRRIHSRCIFSHSELKSGSLL